MYPHIVMLYVVDLGTHYLGDRGSHGNRSVGNILHSYLLVCHTNPFEYVNHHKCKNVINVEPTYNIGTFSIVGQEGILVVNDGKPSIFEDNYEYYKNITEVNNVGQEGISF